jgi:hypothetical protein
MSTPNRESIMEAYFEMRNTAIREGNYDMLKKINKDIEELSLGKRNEQNYFQQQWLYNRFNRR